MKPLSSLDALRALRLVAVLGAVGLACAGAREAVRALDPNEGTGAALSDAGTAALPEASAAVTPAPAAEAGASCGEELPRACLPAGLAQFGRAAPEERFEERPPRAWRARAFALDREEVSAQEYQRCVDSGRCRAAACDDGTPVSAQGPARCIAWEDARAYCEYARGRLPSEAEWERAAAGLLPLHRRYPWGDEEPEGGVPEDRTPEGVRSLARGVAEWVDDVGAPYLLPPPPDVQGADASEAGPSGDAGELGDASDAGAAEAGERAPRARSESNDTAETEGPDAGNELPADAGLTLVDAMPQGPRSGAWRVARGGNDGAPASDGTSTRRRFRRNGERKVWIGFRCAYEL